MLQMKMLSVDITRYSPPEELPIVRSNKKIQYINTAVAFDIETSSFYDSGEKRAIMYAWAFQISDNGEICLGRTWDEFKTLILKISRKYELNDDKKMIVYVHNLAYEFQFLCHLFEWKEIFALEERKPLKAVIKNLGIEFRCNYLLTGTALSKVGQDLHHHTIEKMVGDLDYNLIRHSNTPLKEKEVGYIVNDVRIVTAYITEQIELCGGIQFIPLTKTGRVRELFRGVCLYGKDRPSEKNRKEHQQRRYRARMQALVIRDEKEYKQLKRAFQGGFTHANSLYSGQTILNVASFDFASSYPAVMVSEKFPCAPAEYYRPKTREDFYNCLKQYCCLFDLKIKNLAPKIYTEHPLSFSKCWGVLNADYDNGRIISADSLYTTITEQDFFILIKFYDFDFEIKNFIRYKKAFLPVEMVRTILKLFADKTTLKGVPGKEIDYILSKENINSAYGMCVTDICKDDTIFTDEWGVEPADIEKKLKKYNTSRRRFLCYQWGIWVTAYARRNLFSGIYSVGSDYIYSDTDSIKIRNAEKHIEYIEAYNRMIVKKLYAALDFHGLPHELITPKTATGKTKTLGIWEREPDYQAFKTLGAKRYMVMTDYELSLTVSGVRKQIAVPYLIGKYGKYGAFKAFDDGLYIPPDYSGKKCLTYIDESTSGYVVDYTGEFGEYNELSSVHMENSDFTLSITQDYLNLLKGVKRNEHI